MLFSCTKDNLENLNQDVKAGINSRKITFNEFNKHTKAFNLVNEVNQKQNEPISKLNKIIKNRTENFTIDTQEGLYLEYANLHSFTFPLHREIDSGKLENLVLSYQNDGSYKIKILKYDLTPQEKIDLELDQLKSIQNPIITIPINNINTHLKVKSCDVVTETIWVSCGHDKHDASNVNEWAECESDTPPRVYTVSKIKYIDAEGSTGGDNFPVDGGFDSGSGGSGGGDGNYPVGYPTPETNPEEYEQGISAPVKPALDGGGGDSSTTLNAQAIEDKIDDSLLNLCLKGIMEQLKMATNSDIANVMAKLEATNEYNLTMKMGTVGIGNYAETIKVSKNNYLTTFTQDTYTSTSKLYRATALLHETIHAYMLSVVDDYDTYPTNAPFTDFPELFKIYVSKINPSNTALAAQHEDMANKYVDAIASALEEYQTSTTGIPSSLADKQVFLDMAWSGLRGTDVYNKKSQEGIINDARIFARIGAEQSGSYHQGQYPVGKPCN